MCSIPYLIIQKSKLLILKLPTLGTTEGVLDATQLTRPEQVSGANVEGAQLATVGQEGRKVLLRKGQIEKSQRVDVRSLFPPHTFQSTRE